MKHRWDNCSGGADRCRRSVEAEEAVIWWRVTDSDLLVVSGNGWAWLRTSCQPEDCESSGV